MNQMRLASWVVFVAAPLMVSACSKGSGPAGTEAGAQQLVADLAKPTTDHAAVSKSLRPTSADYKALFEAPLADKVEAQQKTMWDSGQAVIKGKPEQTATKVWGATTDELRSGKGNAEHFPGGYKKIAPQIKPGLTFYSFKFLKPGEELGMAFDGLVHVNGHWVIVPKPFRAAELARCVRAARAW